MYLCSNPLTVEDVSQIAMQLYAGPAECDSLWASCCQSPSCQSSFLLLATAKPRPHWQTWHTLQIYGSVQFSTVDKIKGNQIDLLRLQMICKEKCRTFHFIYKFSGQYKFINKLDANLCMYMFDTLPQTILLKKHPLELSFGTQIIL